MTVIKLDYDYPKWDYVRRLLQTRGKPVLNQFGLKVQEVTVRRSASGKGYHVILTVDRALENFELIFIQLALGSDVNRELFNWRRITHNEFTLPCPRFNVLYNSKLYNGKWKDAIPAREETHDLLELLCFTA